jgi:hypothetical protein
MGEREFASTNNYQKIREGKMTAHLAAEQPAKRLSTKSAESTSQEPISWTESYFIWSALNGNSGSTCYGLNVSGASDSAGAQIILYPWQGGQANELWSYKNDQFITNLNSNLVLGIGDPVQGLPEGSNYIVLVENTGDPSQYWNVNPVTGVITNAQSPNLCLNVMGNQLQAGTNLITYTAQPGATNEMFAVLPAWAAGIKPSPSFRYFTNGLSQQEDGINPFVLTVQDGDNPLGLGLEALGSKPSNQMWQLTTDRRMLSSYGSGNVLEVGTQVNGVWGVQVDLQQVPTTNGQHWSIGMPQSPDVLDNWHLSQSLYVPGGSPYDNPTPVLQSPSSNPDPGFLWYPMPSNPLDSIIIQPPQAFPFFTDGQLVAYQAANEVLGFGQGNTPDFRGQYLNVGPSTVNSSLNSNMTTLWNNGTPPNVSDCDWKAVLGVLNNEVTMVLAVQTVFANYNLWHMKQFDDNNNILSGLITDAQMESNQKLNAVGVAVVQGAVYTALEAIPFVGGVLGNMVNTALNVALAAGQASTSPFPSMVSTLYHDLSQQLMSISGQATLMETAILSDWGKLQAVYPLTQLSSNAPSSLSANALDEQNLLAETTRGYSISAMQMLMPVKYQIYMYAEYNQNPVDNIPSYAQYVSPEKVNGVYRKYWIADSTSWQSTPGETCMNTDIWGNGVSQEDFYTCAKGWGFAVCYVNAYVVDRASSVVVTITNQTANLLTVQASPEGPSPGSMAGASSGTLYPYASLTLAANADEGCNVLEVAFNIYDPEVSTENAIASFTATQMGPGLSATTPTVSGQTTNNGYVFSTPLCNHGSAAMRHEFAGSVQIGVYLG